MQCPQTVTVLRTLDLRLRQASQALSMRVRLGLEPGCCLWLDESLSLDESSAEEGKAWMRPPELELDMVLDGS